MNYYKRHIGDYMKDAAHLSLLEHGVFMRLMDVYYTREAPIPQAQAARLIGARSKEELAAMAVVLADFFTLVDGCFVQGRCDREIAAMQAKQETNRVVGARGGRPRKAGNRNPDGFQTETQMVSENGGGGFDVGTLATSHKPIAINQGALVEHQQAGGEPFGPVGPARAGFEKLDRPDGPSGSGSGGLPVVAAGHGDGLGGDGLAVLAAAAARQMAAAGLADVSPTHPRLRALLQAGLTVDELASAARVAAGSGRGFPWALARAEGQRRDAALLLAGGLPAAAPAVDQDSRAALEADGEALGLGRWQAVDDRTGRAVPWAEYRAKVLAARAERERSGVAA